MPRVKNFRPRVTKMTTRARPQWFSPPNSGLPISGTPPAAYLMPTGISARPMVRTTMPVTSGGRRLRIRPITVPRRKWKSPPMTMPPNSARHPGGLDHGDHDRNEGEAGALDHRQAGPDRAQADGLDQGRDPGEDHDHLNYVDHLGGAEGEAGGEADDDRRA